MATKKKGILSLAPEWRKHLRWLLKRKAWKRERQAAQRDTKIQAQQLTGLSKTSALRSTGLME